MWVWRETSEKWLLAAALAVLGVIILINLKLDVWPWLNGGSTAAFLRAVATGSVTSDLLVGLFSAYVFYVVIESRYGCLADLYIPSPKNAPHTLRIASRHIPEPGAVCGSFARTDLCGGRQVTAVPTVTALSLKF